MRRRALLAGLATAGSLVAGCIDDGGTSPTDAETPTDTETPTDAETPTEATPAASVSVTDVTLQQGLVVPDSPDSIGVEHTDRRFLWAYATVEGDAVERGAFTLTTGQDEVAPITDRQPFRTMGDDEQRFEGREGWLCFELPLTVAEPTLALRWPGGEAPIADAIEERLASQPPSLTATLHGQYEETPMKPVVVEATNEGDVPGRFVGAVNRAGDVPWAPVGRVSALIEPGETVRLPVEDPVHDGTPTPGEGEEATIDYHLYWATGRDYEAVGNE